MNIGIQRNTGVSSAGRFSGFGVGVLCGLAAMYFLDERGGPRRRAMARDKAIRWQRLGLQTFDKRTRDLGNRIYGTYVEMMNAFRSNEAVDDEILVDRIRSKIGRVVAHPKMIHIECRDGRVFLSGFALKSEMNRLYDCVRHVRGVHTIAINNVRPVRDEREMSASASAQGLMMQQGRGGYMTH